MAEEIRQSESPPVGGDRRKRDRRRSDRRQLERRLPPPWWRRPLALVLYGVVGTLIVVLFLNRSRPPGIPAGGSADVTTVAPGAPVVEPQPVQPPATPPEDARTLADHERLVVAGDEANGRWVRVELYCSSVSRVALRGVDGVERPVAELADTDNRVPAAECKWGAHEADTARPDVLLLVPPAVAESFASAPLVQDGFVARRRIDGVAEWIGRSDALALRTALVLRQHPAIAAR